MNYCDMIHETVIRDVLDMLEDLKNADAVDAINNRAQNKSFRSIAAATSNLTLVFPCIVSRVMNIENASMFSKAMERKAVSMLQMLFSALSITNAEDGISYLKNFHTNLKLDGSMTIDKFMNMMDHLVLEGAVEIDDQEIYSKYSRDLKNLGNYLPASIVESTSLANYVIMKESNSLEESYILNESKADDLITGEMEYLDTEELLPNNNPHHKDKKKKLVKEAQTPHGLTYDADHYKDHKDYALKVDMADKEFGIKYSNVVLKNTQDGINNSQSDRSFNHQVQQDGINNSQSDRSFNHQVQQANIKNTQTDRAYDHQLDQDNIRNQQANDNLDFQKSKADNDEKWKLQQQRDSEERFNYQKDTDVSMQKYQQDQDGIRNQQVSDKMELDRDRYNADLVRNNIDYLKNQLLDNDVKKPNELVPTTMIVNYVSKGENGRPIQSQSVIGVKAKLYPVNSDDILKRLTIKHVDKHWLIGLIKATTREISFFRDFLFAIDKAKLDAISQSRKGSSSKLWKILERRGIKSRVNRTIGSINDATAITSLAITQEEVEYLKKIEDIDLEDPKVVRPIMESYNLMCFCIQDENNEVAKFIFDTGDDIYEEMAFRSLEREDKGNDYKKIINLMSKIR